MTWGNGRVMENSEGGVMRGGTRMESKGVGDGWEGNGRQRVE